jgi:hypothetical protein
MVVEEVEVMVNLLKLELMEQAVVVELMVELEALEIHLPQVQHKEVLVELVQSVLKMVEGAVELLQ